MTKEQVRNVIGVVVVSVVVIVGAILLGTRDQKKQAVESGVQNVTEAVKEAVTPTPVAAPAVPAEPQAAVTERESEVAGGKVSLSFSEGKGTVTYSGVDTALVEQFFAQEAQEIDGLTYTMDGADKVQVTYMGFSELDDQIVADWLLEDAAALAK